MTDILLILGGYLFGSISTAIVVCRLMGLPDPRSVGSGNPGATNVLRLGGKKAAFLTLVGDMAFFNDGADGEPVVDPIGQSLDRYNETFLEIGEYLGKYLGEITERIDEKIE